MLDGFFWEGGKERKGSGLVPLFLEGGEGEEGSSRFG